MANMNIGTPRFYVDEINYLMARGVAATEFAVTDTDAGNTFIGDSLMTTGSTAELFDMRPLNKVTFNTSSDTDGHVLITIDTQTATSVSYIAILNHNLKTAVGKIRVFCGDAASDVTALDGANADTSDQAWSNTNAIEMINADTTTAAPDSKSVVIEPAADGSTIIKFTNQNLRFYAIQLEGNTTNTGNATNGTWGSTNAFVGCIMLGEHHDMPHSPDLDLTRMISYNRLNDLQESHGGQRFSNLKTIGRTASTTSKSPFTTASNAYESFGGRIIYDMKFSFLSNTELMPDEYNTVPAPSSSVDDDNFVSDVWNKTHGNHLPFIFTIDKESEGNNAESEYIFGRFANNSLDMTQVAPELYNVSLTVEEEF